MMPDRMGRGDPHRCSPSTTERLRPMHHFNGERWGWGATTKGRNMATPTDRRDRTPRYGRQMCLPDARGRVTLANAETEKKILHPVATDRKQKSAIRGRCVHCGVECYLRPLERVTTGLPPVGFVCGGCFDG